ncbi:hypothetical protein [Gracilimonas sp.]|uniref:hypothetical protein n=1 Tax=Gracilimonas sp. TaxID=1974203 RepID=UPI0032EBE646
MRKLLIVLVLIVPLGCDVFENEQTVPVAAIGNWEWTHSAGGWGPYADADSVDYTMKLTLHAHEATWYRDDEITGEFWITERKKGWQENSFYMKWKDKKSCDLKGRYNSAENLLTLSSAGCTDSPSHYFKKVSH